MSIRSKTRTSLVLGEYICWQFDGLIVVRSCLDKYTLSRGMKGAETGLYIGGGKDLSEGSLWSGLVDDVRVYDRAIEP